MKIKRNSTLNINPIHTTIESDTTVTLDKYKNYSKCDNYNEPPNSNYNALPKFFPKEIINSCYISNISDYELIMEHLGQAIECLVLYSESNPLFYEKSLFDDIQLEEEKFDAFELKCYLKDVNVIFNTSVFFSIHVLILLNSLFQERKLIITRINIYKILGTIVVLLLKSNLYVLAKDINRLIFDFEYFELEKFDKYKEIIYSKLDKRLDINPKLFKDYVSFLKKNLYFSK